MTEFDASVDTIALGRFVREKRLARGWTQSELARRNSWTQERVSLLENGKYGLPALPALVHLAESLEVPPAELLAALGLQLGNGPMQSDRVSITEAVEAIRRISGSNTTLASSVQDLHLQVTAIEEQMLQVDDLRSRLRASRQSLGAMTSQLRGEAGASG